ncbi:EAL domain-containing protein [Aeromonas salmonicida]|uniref:EAL domain-containing protein n=1 Tax=Aeromonas salmonicida TaxID=645 RepID=UPI003D03D0EF
MSTNNSSIRKRKTYDNELRFEALRAMTQDNILEQTIAYYQPQFIVTSGKLYGAEALVRWDHPKLGILGPYDLLPFMDSISLRRTLWERMLGYTISMLGALESSDLCLSVNVSADVSSSTNWAGSVIQRVTTSNISSNRLTIEITEDDGNEFDMDLADTVKKLRAEGFNCAIDDFGTGSSSIKRLSLVSFNILKIDKIFINQARTSILGQKILTNIVLMAHDLGLLIVAEGIENQCDFDRIANLGVDIAQGYYLSKPITGTELIEMSLR